jgi:hypothetical protein
MGSRDRRATLRASFQSRGFRCQVSGFAFRASRVRHRAGAVNAAFKKLRATFRRCANQTPLPPREGLGEGLSVRLHLNFQLGHSR